jgi:hypothetical protein
MLRVEELEGILEGDAALIIHGEGEFPVRWMMKVEG